MLMAGPSFHGQDHDELHNITSTLSMIKYLYNNETLSNYLTDVRIMQRSQSHEFFLQLLSTF